MAKATPRKGMQPFDADEALIGMSAGARRHDRCGGRPARSVQPARWRHRPGCSPQAACPYVGRLSVRAAADQARP
jgi:hypothetical protein